jgi:hypothetical protein
MKVSRGVMETDWRLPFVVIDRPAVKELLVATALMPPAAARPATVPDTPLLDSLHRP